MVRKAKLHASASSSSVRPVRIEGLMMAVIFHHYKELLELAEELYRMERMTGGEGSDELR